MSSLGGRLSFENCRGVTVDSGQMRRSKYRILDRKDLFEGLDSCRDLESSRRSLRGETDHAKFGSKSVQLERVFGIDLNQTDMLESLS